MSDDGEKMLTDDPKFTARLLREGAKDAEAGQGAGMAKNCVLLTPKLARKIADLLDGGAE